MFSSKLFVVTKQKRKKKQTKQSKIYSRVDGNCFLD